MIFCFNAAEVFRIAIAIEENGKAFYEKARNAIEDPEVRNLFADLAQEEIGHRTRFEEMKNRFAAVTSAPPVEDPENQLDAYLQMMADQHVFRSSSELDSNLARIRTAEDALRLALQFEKDSVIFFLGMQEATCEGKDRDLIGLLIKEEQDHVRRLALQLLRLKR